MADKGGTEAFTFANQKLELKWKNANGGTSPVIAGGLLYVYDAEGKLRVYEPRRAPCSRRWSVARELEQSDRRGRADRDAGGKFDGRATSGR